MPVLFHPKHGPRPLRPAIAVSRMFGAQMEVRSSTFNDEVSTLRTNVQRSPRDPVRIANPTMGEAELHIQSPSVNRSAQSLGLSWAC